jgi:hypothetical protein
MNRLTAPDRTTLIRSRAEKATFEWSFHDMPPGWRLTFGRKYWGSMKTEKNRQVKKNRQRVSDNLRKKCRKAWTKEDGTDENRQ